MDKIKSMSELELDGFLAELSEHLCKNDMRHLLKDDRVDELESDLEAMTLDYNSLESEKDDLVDRIDEIQTALDNFDIYASEADMQKAIDKIRDI